MSREDCVLSDIGVFGRVIGGEKHPKAAGINQQTKTSVLIFHPNMSSNLSPIGIGTYLGNADEATDANYTRAIVRAVQLGCNVIDTAANYRFQRSERSIGRALEILANEHGIRREELVICTKGGYIPFDGAPPRNMREYVLETFVKPGIASFEDFVDGHCMAAAYLQSQLDQSLRNMGVKYVDVYYVHNPESQ